MAAPKKNSTASKSKKGGSKKKSAPVKEPRRREAASIVCLFLGLIALFGCFNISAIFLDLFSNLVKGLFGWGCFILPIALFACSFILAFHRGRPVAMRVTCTMLIPVVTGCLVHLILCSVDLPFTSSIISKLWTTGKVLQSGGVVCGLVAETLETLLSGVVTGIILVLFLIILVFAMLNLRIADIVDWFRNREVVEYELEPEPEPRLMPEPRGKKKKADRLTGSIKSMIDIPVDDSPVIQYGDDEQGFKRDNITLKEPNVLSPDKFVSVSEVKTKGSPFDFMKNLGMQDEAEAKAEAEVKDEPMPEHEKAEAEKVDDKINEQIISSIEIPRKIKASDVEAETVAIHRTIELNSQMAHEVEEYRFPLISILKNGTSNGGTGGKDEVAKNAKRLSLALESFGIDAKITNVTRGPSITRYELELEAGVKLNKLTNLADDLALSLGASGVRIAPIPDKISTVGIEVPNKLVSVVSLKEVIASDTFKNAKSKLSFALGKDISGTPIVGNIAKLPHLLIAGTTGSGKSVCMNSLILSVLYKARPDEVKFIMIDPKMVEFGVYNGIPHLLIPVVTDPKKAAGALQWAVTEMLRRYQKFSKTGLRDLASYNKYAAEADNPEYEVVPQIVVVIDELADLMLVASKEVEESICRVAQMGRAAGIHLVIATQRPSADVITGLMKANIPSRIALSVSSSLESRIILDTQGAEKLVGNGDMLYSPIGQNKPMRVQGTFVSDMEREKVIDFLKEGSEAQYSEEVSKAIEEAAVDKSNGGGKNIDDDTAGDRDSMFDEAVLVVLELGQASVSMLQRKLKLGYSRAARLMDQMEEAEIVGPFEGSKPRQVLITKEQWFQNQGIAPAGMDAFEIDDSFSPENSDEDAF